MAFKADKGIVLKRKNYLESDRLLTIYTRKLGKIRARALGVRRSRSKLGGHLELFYAVDLRLAEGRNFYTITQAQMIHAPLKLPHNLPSASTIFLVAETVDVLTLEQHPQPEIYDLLKETIDFIDQKDFPLMASIFMLKILFILGYKMDLKFCVSCGRKLTEQNIKFSTKLHGFIDKADFNQDRQATPISGDTIKLIRIAVAGNRLLRRLNISNKVRKELINLANRYRYHIVDDTLKSEKFFEEMHARMG